jgi:hypothetical protein
MRAVRPLPMRAPPPPMWPPPPPLWPLNAEAPDTPTSPAIARAAQREAVLHSALASKGWALIARQLPPWHGMRGG